MDHDFLLKTLEYMIDRYDCIYVEKSSMIYVAQLYCELHPEDRPDWVSALANGNIKLFDDLIDFVRSEKKG